jgi:hypothetical protein
MSWEFADGSHLAVSIETRKEEGEEYSAMRGFFRQFELYYVVADERDLIALRTNHRDERVELYRMIASKEGARALLYDDVREMNALAEQPRWYNALTHNCTTTIWHHARAVGSDFPTDWRLLANGYLIDLLLMTLAGSLPAAEEATPGVHSPALVNAEILESRIA